MFWNIYQIKSIIKKVSVRIHWMGSVLLLSANFFSIDEITLSGPLHMLTLNWFIWRQNASHTGWILRALVFLETHCHLRALTTYCRRSNTSNYANCMVIICHLKYFLLLSSQRILIGIIIIFLTVHVGKSHGSRHEYIVILTWIIIWSVNLTSIRWSNSLLVNIIIMMLLKVMIQLVKVLILLLSVFIAIVSYISALLARTTNWTFLIMTV